MVSKLDMAAYARMLKVGVSLTLGVAIAAGAQQSPAASGAPTAPLPQGETIPQSVAPAHPFPTPNPKNFTATSPTKEDVDSFLTAMWGYDPNRIWSVAGILSTAAPGVSKIVVLVGDKSQSGKTASTVFFTTPDGKHAIADNVIDFGAKPFAATRALLQTQANGPARGSAGKDLELVEFADLQCLRCKDAQTAIDNLLQDFPQARVVYESFPITEIHPFALQAAAEGECVRRAKGDAGFFTYAQAVYDNQDGLTKERVDATLGAAATKAGADRVATATCAATPAATEAVAAEVTLGRSIGVDQTPMLAVNGHLLPLASVPYEVLKRIVAFQAAQDGLTVRVQPTLKTLK